MRPFFRHLRNYSVESAKNIPRKLGLFLLSFYRIYLSPYFGGNCRFYPSCSCYAEEAFQAFPPTTAFKLTFFRLMKCHPFGKQGFDPLPLDKGNSYESAK